MKINKLRRNASRRPLKEKFWHAIFAIALANACAAGCGDDRLSIDIHIVVERPDAAPAAASVTAQLDYEQVALKRARLDQDAAAASVTAGAALLAALDPAPFARIAHFTDVQIREERGFLFREDGQVLLDLVNSSYVPTEGAKRQSLQEANSPFYWLAAVLTLNAIHAERPVDFAIHTGDAVEIGLRSELEHFLHVARKLAVPFFAVAGNHDTLGFGIWTKRRPYVGIELDRSVRRRSAVEATWQANGDFLVLDRASHARTLRDVSTAVGPHEPTQSRFGSVHFGTDLAPESDDLFYAVAIKPPAAGAPGLYLIVLETNAQEGGADAEIDQRQLDFLNDALDSTAARGSVVVIAAHHPVFEVHRDDGGFGAPTRIRTSDALRPVHRALGHYPNVALYLCGHTHLPDVRESRDAGDLLWTQIDSGSLLIQPQEGALIDLVIPSGGGALTIRARKFGPEVVDGSALAQRVAESREAAAADRQSRPRYVPWTQYEATKPLPAFPVTVPKLSW